jgi:hypothetical protein
MKARNELAVFRIRVAMLIKHALDEIARFDLALPTGAALICNQTSPR